MDVLFSHFAEVEESSGESSSSGGTSSSTFVVSMNVKVVLPSRNFSKQSSESAGDGTDDPGHYGATVRHVRIIIPPLAEPGALLARALLQPSLQFLHERRVLEFLDCVFGILHFGIRGVGDMERLDGLEVPRGGLLERGDGQIREASFESVHRPNRRIDVGSGRSFAGHGGDWLAGRQVLQG